MAASLKNAFGVDSRLIRGGGGIFDVKVNGKLVYSKHETGCFPDHDLLIEKIGALVG